MTCEMCGGTGEIEVADVYRSYGGYNICPAVVAWDFSRIIACGCQQEVVL